MSFKPYPKYKESGVEWLGRVPEHWTVMPIRLAARLESGHTPSRNHPEYWVDCTIPWFTLADVWQIREGLTDVVTETKEKVSELGVANSAARVLPAGTVMLSRTASVGFSAIMGVDMATTQDFANWVCGPDVVPRFLLQAFRAMGSEFCRLMMGSTHNTIYMPDIASFRFVLPPPAEQSAVVSFIDHETAKIDALIAEQQRLIELLQEKRQAVISHAVTKGLNPDVPMKDSGIEWLGQVPEHWEVRRFQRCVDVAEGQVDPSDVTYSSMPLIAPNHIESGTGRLLELETAAEQAAESGKYQCKAGDIVYSKIRPALRKVCVAPSDCLCSADMYPLRPHSGLTGGYLFWTMLSEYFSAFAILESDRVAMPKINRESLKQLVVPMPPRDEQLMISSYLDQETAGLDSLIAEQNRAISLLQERRSALISAAVTGQIDVRGFAGGSEAA